VHLDDPLRFVRVLVEFMQTTAPACIRAGSWKALLRRDADGAVPPQPRSRRRG
jgi:hypothetical protein